MGYMADEAVIVSSTFWDDNGERVLRDFGGVPFVTRVDVAAFRDLLPEKIRPLLVGPIPYIINGGATFVFAPDGSKEGWDLSDEVDVWRAKFMNLFAARHSDGSSHYNVLFVRWGHDAGSEEGAAIKYANDPHHDKFIRQDVDAANR